MSDLFGKNKNDFTVIIDDREIICDSATLIKTMDTGADACSVIMPWSPGLDQQIDSITKPYSYSTARIYLGGKFVSEQVLYDVTQTTDNAGTKKTLEFWSKTADLIDSTVIPPYEMNNVKLTDRCKQQSQRFGISVIVGEDAAASINETRRVIVEKKYKSGASKQLDRAGQTAGPYDPINGMYGNYTSIATAKTSKLVTDEKRFPRVTADPTDNVFTHLSKLAAQRGLLLSCTANGDLLLTKANVNAEPVGSIIEDSIYLSMNKSTGETESFSCKFAGRDRFATYKALVKSSSSKPKFTQMAYDNIVKSPRLLTFNADDNIPGEAKSAAEWRKNKTAADAMSFSFPVNSWYAPNGELWSPNTTITVKSPTMSVKNGFTFLITRVEFIFSSSGCTAKLDLKPPTVYSTGEIEEPWI